MSRWRFRAQPVSFAWTNPSPSSVSSSSLSVESTELELFSPPPVHAQRASISRIEPHTVLLVATSPSQSTRHICDDGVALDDLETQRIDGRLRDAACLIFTVFTAVGVLSCLALVLSGSPAPSAQAAALLQAIKRSRLIEVSIMPKPHIVWDNNGHHHQETTDFFGIVSINGQLFPVIAGDGSNSLHFDGWMQVQTNTNVTVDYHFANHRGYRVVRSGKVSSGRRARCVDQRDHIPPLHDLHSVARGAFEAQHYEEFHTRCTNGEPPVEVVVAHMPFLFCFDELVPLIAPVERARAKLLKASQAILIHGGRMLCRLILVNSEDESAAAEAARSQQSVLEAWGNATRAAVTNCPFIDAPLSSGVDAPRSFLYDQLKEEQAASP